MGIEENTLAILDSTGTKETRDANDDSMCLPFFPLMAYCGFMRF